MIERMRNAGTEGNNIVSYVAGAPTRMLGNSMEGLRGVNFRTQSIMRGVLDAGLVVPRQVGREILFMPFGVAGRVLAGTRNAVMSTLGAVGTIGYHAVMDGVRVPLGFDPRDVSPARLPRIESALNAGQSIPQALESTRRDRSGPGAGATGPNDQPGA